MLAQAFAGWVAAVAERKRQRHLVRQSLARIVKAEMARALATWEDNVAELRRHRNIIKQVTARMRLGLLARAFAGWADAALVSALLGAPSLSPEHLGAVGSSSSSFRMSSQVLPDDLPTAPTRPCVGALCTACSFPVSTDTRASIISL